jgi:AcrR family transcriptional regulator
MSMPSGRRSRKRLATRHAIASAAWRLFQQRGFDAVTVDEVAAAADVARMTVFNYFPRKEDLFFDRDEEGRKTLRTALRAHDPGVSPIEALRRLAHQLVAEGRPYVEFSSRSQAFIAAIERSEVLKARARAIRDEIAQLVAAGFAEWAGEESASAGPQLGAALLLATWSVALLQAHRTFRQSEDTGRAEAAFLAIIDSGSAGLIVAMAWTPYA